MGMPGGTKESIRRKADAAAATMVADLAALRRAENVAAAAVVHCVHDLTELRFAAESDIHQLGDEADIAYAQRAVECEAAVALSLPCRAARDLVKVGAELAWRLPAVDTAFSSGEVDYPRVRAIVLTLDKASVETLSALESEVLAAATRVNVASLKEKIWKLWFEHDAKEASAARTAIESEERCADIRRGDDGTATLISKMSTLEGAECDAVLDEIAGTVCAHDPRTKRQLRGFTLLALVHREEYIACTCPLGDDCPVRWTRDEQQPRRKPLVQIVVDIETLLGLMNEPATLSDGTILDPEVVRQVAGDANWQILLSEALTAAHVRLAEKDKAESEPGTGSGCETSSTPDLPAPGMSGTPRARRLVARGKIRRGGAVPAPSDRSGSGDRSARDARKSSGGVRLIRGDEVALSAAIAGFLAAAADDPSLTRGVHPDGHGGFSEPPPGALTYRPSTEMVTLVRATFCTCTFPGCSVPAARCEIDHIVPFDRNDPSKGGWTILSNLQPLCTFHHQAKTLKLWAASKLKGDSIYWTSTSGLHRITPSTFGTVDIPESFTHNTNARPTAGRRSSEWASRTFGQHAAQWATMQNSAMQDSAMRGSDAGPERATAGIERVPSDALYEPTWWEMNICDTDSDWTRLINFRNPVADGTMRIPTLGDIAHTTDPQDRADAIFIRKKFLEHLAVITARYRILYRAPF